MYSSLFIFQCLCAIPLMQRWTTILGQGPQHIIFSAFEGRIQNYELNFHESSIKTENYLSSLSIACGLILLPSELFRIVINCKIVNNSMKFKFIQKIFVIQEKFLVLLNLLRGPDIGNTFGGRIRGLCIPALMHQLLSLYFQLGHH